jgi:hypothetical protein
MAELYKRTVCKLRRSFLWGNNGGTAKCKGEMNLIIDEIAMNTVRIMELEHSLMREMSMGHPPDMNSERLLNSMKLSRTKAIGQLQNLREGKDMTLSKAGRQGYRGVMTRSKIMKQEIAREQTINEDDASGTDRKETLLGDEAGSDIRLPTEMDSGPL